jgi:hypothetical protein
MILMMIFSSVGVCIIWLGRVSSGAGEYHLGLVSFGRGGYLLEDESIIGGVCIIWLGRV